ncbi:hypothetical protein [Posidoniimonas corsicana]|uniref:hypothetical protein n=1 Tax=Posidoniimonas corsicana TaxID=1938618 RepID=UPI0011B378EC|nr:hypothetical protein [Posidoniimonas corsicana]
MDNQTTTTTPLGACCLNCAAALERRAQQLDSCPQCGREFDWRDESSWAASYWHTRAASRQLGAIGAVLTAVFALGAVQSGTFSWVLAFVLAGIITGNFAYRGLR